MQHLNKRQGWNSNSLVKGVVGFYSPGGSYYAEVGAVACHLRSCARGAKHSLTIAKDIDKQTEAGFGVLTGLRVARLLKSVQDTLP